jgi:hypothetical protein
VKRLLSATEKALKAKEEMESLFQAAINEQLGIIKDAEKRLAELGYDAKLKVKTGPSGTGTRRSRLAKKYCSVCDVNGHDGRAHRGQGKTKKKFTNAELKEKGIA